jgi:asparagine N-glycosylation enzyme membrane subunit Stt3
MVNRRYIIALFLIAAFSFLFHSSIYFILDTSRYNFYDTDTWYTVHEIDRLTHGENIDFDPLMNYPDGRAIDWGSFVPCFYSLFATQNDTPLDIFNKIGWIPPILSTLFIVVIYLLVSILFSQRVGLYSAAILSIIAGGFFNNSLFGIIDHHLIECIITTIGILCILIAFKKSEIIWILPIIPSAAILYFTSTLYMMYLGLWSLCLAICIIYTNKYKIPIVTIAALVAFLVLNNSHWFYLWFNYIGPISEMAPMDIMTFVIRYNILIPVIILGILLVSEYKSERETFALLVVFSCVLLCAFRFVRVGYILTPMFSILSAYYIDKFLSEKSMKCVMCGFFLISFVSGASLIYELQQTAHNNDDWNEALDYLKSQNQGLALSWWDYGHWIVAVANQPPYTNPFQDRVIAAAKIFTSDTKPNLSGISYIVVTDGDQKFYDAMLWYSKSNVTYNNSYLNKLIDERGDALVFKRGSVKIYQV